jgi:hypothetical protein
MSRNLVPQINEPQWAALVAMRGECRKTTSTFGVTERGVLLFAFEFPLLQIVILAMTLQPHILRLEVAAAQPQFHLIRDSPLRVRARRRLHAPTRAQPQQSKQALPAEHICKFYHLSNMFGICSRIYCSYIPYSQSGMPPMFYDLA